MSQHPLDTSTSIYIYNDYLKNLIINVYIYNDQVKIYSIRGSANQDMIHYTTTVRPLNIQIITFCISALRHDPENEHAER